MGRGGAGGWAVRRARTERGRPVLVGEARGSDAGYPAPALAHNSAIKRIISVCMAYSQRTLYANPRSIMLSSPNTHTHKQPQVQALSQQCRHTRWCRSTHPPVGAFKLLLCPLPVSWIAAPHPSILTSTSARSSSRRASNAAAEAGAEKVRVEEGAPVAPRSAAEVPAVRRRSPSIHSMVRICERACMCT